MRSLKLLIAATGFALCAFSCTNNRNSNTNDVDSTSLSTNPAMQTPSDSGVNTANGMRSSDSTDIMTSPTDSGRGGTSAGSGSSGDSLQH